MEWKNDKSVLFGKVNGLPDGDSRKIVFVASDATKDRHKSILNPNAWQIDNFNANPITGYQHNVYGPGMCSEPNPDDVLGPARAWIEGDKLLVEIDFETKDLNPLADKIFRKIKNKSLRAVSVGFLPKGEGKYGEKKNGEAEGMENETYYYEAQELLEVSVVNIPSNPAALKKSLRGNTKDALIFLVKAFGDKYSLSDIDNMRVCEIRQLLENGKPINKDNAESSNSEDTGQLDIEEEAKKEKENNNRRFRSRVFGTIKTIELNK